MPTSLKKIKNPKELTPPRIRHISQLASTAAHRDLSRSSNQEAEGSRWRCSRTGQFSGADNHCMRACMHKSLQSCPTLCDPVDCSPPGASVRGTLQARTLEWAVMPSSVDLRYPETEPSSLTPPALVDGLSTTTAAWEAPDSHWKGDEIKPQPARTTGATTESVARPLRENLGPSEK